MQIIGGPSLDASAPGTMETGVAVNGGVLILHNLSTYDLILTFRDSKASTDTTRQAMLHAWQQRQFDFCGHRTETVAWAPAYTPPASLVQAAATSFLWGEAYVTGETVPTSLPNYDRLSNVGNTVTTQGGSANVKNDGNSPGTQIIESTPSDQALSSMALNNDGSGAWQVLSAGFLRRVLAVTRGNAGAGKALIQIGDTADATITLFAGRAANNDFLATDQGAPYSLVRAGSLGSGTDFFSLARTNDHPHTYLLSIDGSGNFGVWDGTNGVWATLANNPTPAGQVTPGAFPAGIYNMQATSANSDYFRRWIDHNGARQGVEGADTSGIKLYSDTLAGFLIYQGLLQPAGLAAGTLPSGVVVPLAALAAGALPAGVTVALAATADAIDATNSGSTTTPQVRTTAAGAGLSIKDNKASGRIEVVPTMTDATARGIMLDYQDAAGVLHAGLWVDGTGKGSVPGTMSAEGNVLIEASSAGGGTAGHVVWTGTTDPAGSAAEGDLWIGA